MARQTPSLEPRTDLVSWVTANLNGGITAGGAYERVRRGIDVNNRPREGTSADPTRCSSTPVAMHVKVPNVVAVASVTASTPIRN